MRYTKRFVAEVRGSLTDLGLRRCVVCGSDGLAFSGWPVLLPVKGTPWPARPRDPDAGVMYAVAVRCDRCGHLLLFDSEVHRDEGLAIIAGLGGDEEDGPGGGEP